jgi:hypothetical protein
VQPHPEFRPEFVEGLMRTRGPGLVPDNLMAEARDRLTEPLDDQTMAGRIASFFLTHQTTKTTEKTTDKTTGAEKLRA